MAWIVGVGEVSECSSTDRSQANNPSNIRKTGGGNEIAFSQGLAGVCV